MRRQARAGEACGEEVTLPSNLTPDERQEVLRRLKRGPDLPREELVEFANRVRREVLAKREKEQK